MEAHSVLPSTGLQAPAGSQPLLSRVPGIGLQTWDQSTARSSLTMGWFPCAAAVLGSPNPQGKPAQHIHLPLDGRTAPGKARAGRRFLGTNGVTLWLCPQGHVPVSDRHELPGTTSRVLSSLCPVSWVPTSHVCMVPSKPSSVNGRKHRPGCLRQLRVPWKPG